MVKKCPLLLCYSPLCLLSEKYKYADLNELTLYTMLELTRKDETLDLWKKLILGTNEMFFLKFYKWSYLKSCQPLGSIREYVYADIQLSWCYLQDFNLITSAFFLENYLIFKHIAPNLLLFCKATSLIIYLSLFPEGKLDIRSPINI